MGNQQRPLNDRPNRAAVAFSFRECNDVLHFFQKLGSCAACGSSGTVSSTRHCGICLGSGEWVDCLEFDPVDPAAMYARTIQREILLATSPVRDYLTRRFSGWMAISVSGIVALRWVNWAINCYPLALS